MLTQPEFKQLLAQALSKRGLNGKKGEYTLFLEAYEGDASVLEAALTPSETMSHCDELEIDPIIIEHLTRIVQSP